MSQLAIANGPRAEADPSEIPLDMRNLHVSPGKSVKGQLQLQEANGNA